MGISKLTTSAHYAMSNGDTEWLKHSIAQMLSLIVDACQGDEDEHVPHVATAYNDSVCSGRSFIPNNLQSVSSSNVLLSVIERRGARGHRRLERD